MKGGGKTRDAQPDTCENQLETRTELVLHGRQSITPWPKQYTHRIFAGNSCTARAAPSTTRRTGWINSRPLHPTLYAQANAPVCDGTLVQRPDRRSGCAKRRELSVNMPEELVGAQGRRCACILRGSLPARNTCLSKTVRQKMSKAQRDIEFLGRTAVGSPFRASIPSCFSPLLVIVWTYSTTNNVRLLKANTDYCHSTCNCCEHHSSNPYPRISRLSKDKARYGSGEALEVDNIFPSHRMIRYKIS